MEAYLPKFYGGLSLISFVEVYPHRCMEVYPHWGPGQDPTHAEYYAVLKQAAALPDFLWRCVELTDPQKETKHIGFHPEIIKAILAPTSFDIACLTWGVVLPWV